MTIFFTSLNQTAFLFSFIILGYILYKLKIIPDNSQSVLSKMENLVFIPALVLGTFMENFTVAKIKETGDLLITSLFMAIIGIMVSVLLAHVCSKDGYERNIFTYALSFSNFGFMGNAVVSALFPDVFLQYLVFTLPFWSLIYLWGAPVLLIGGAEKVPLKSRLKNFLNPMFVCTLLGIIIGLSGIPIPKFLSSAASAAGNCMSPVAMLITGMAAARIDIKKVIKIKKIYAVSFLRLLVYPSIFLILLAFISIPKTFATCIICMLSMPLGLNTVIIPDAYGKDTTVASGMCLLSHLFGCVTIPLVFMVFELLI